jgi:hypothetical protein
MTPFRWKCTDRDRRRSFRERKSRNVDTWLVVRAPVQRRDRQSQSGSCLQKRWVAEADSGVIIAAIPECGRLTDERICGIGTRIDMSIAFGRRQAIVVVGEGVHRVVLGTLVIDEKSALGSSAGFCDQHVC